MICQPPAARARPGLPHIFLIDGLYGQRNNSKTLNFVSLVFKEPKDNFKCYTRKHFQPKHWSS